MAEAREADGSQLGVFSGFDGSGEGEKVGVDEIAGDAVFFDECFEFVGEGEFGGEVWVSIGR